MESPDSAPPATMMSASGCGRCRTRRAVKTQLFCLGIAGVITFPVVDYLLYDPDWSHGNGPTLLFIAVEAIGIMAQGFCRATRQPSDLGSASPAPCAGWRASKPRGRSRRLRRGEIVVLVVSRPIATICSVSLAAGRT